MEDGVWRTIGGRRVFIKEGQSVSEAMKASGKFKSATKKNKKQPDYDKRPQSDVDKENNRNNRDVEKIEKGMKDFDPNDFEKWRSEVDPDYEMDDDRARSRYETYKESKRKDDGSSKQEKETKSRKDMNIDPYEYADNLKEPKTEFDRLAMQYKDTLDTATKYNTERKRMYKGFDEEKAKDYLSEKDYKKFQDLTEKYETERSKLSDIYNKMEDEYNVKEDTTKASNKFKNSPSDIKKNVSDFERVGLKVEKAFETDAFGTGKEDRFKLSDGRYIAHSTESMGKKEDVWSINKVEGGDIKSQEFKSYDDMIKHLSNSSSEADVPKSSEISGIPNRRNETPGQTISNIMKENQAYKKAFEEYKKKHPNSKLTFGKFVDISEGK